MKKMSEKRSIFHSVFLKLQFHFALLKWLSKRSKQLAKKQKTDWWPAFQWPIFYFNNFTNIFKNSSYKMMIVHLVLYSTILYQMSMAIINDRKANFSVANQVLWTPSVDHLEKSWKLINENIFVPFYRPMNIFWKVCVSAKLSWRWCSLAHSLFPLTSLTTKGPGASSPKHDWADLPSGRLAAAHIIFPSKPF